MPVPAFISALLLATSAAAERGIATAATITVGGGGEPLCNGELRATGPDGEETRSLFPSEYRGSRDPASGRICVLRRQVETHRVRDQKRRAHAVDASYSWRMIEVDNPSQPGGKAAERTLYATGPPSRPLTAHGAFHARPSPALHWRSIKGKPPAPTLQSTVPATHPCDMLMSELSVSSVSRRAAPGEGFGVVARIMNRVIVTAPRIRAGRVLAALFASPRAQTSAPSHAAGALRQGSGDHHRRLMRQARDGTGG